MSTDRKTQEAEWTRRLSDYRDAINPAASDEATARAIRAEAIALDKTLNRMNPADFGLSSILGGIIDVARWRAACRKNGWAA